MSIVIPLYNKESYILQVLECIESQTFKNWECIIIDDGSTDKSPQLVREFLSIRGDKWQYLRQDNKGQAAARNRGIELSRGKFLAFLDADDYWPNYKLESQVNLLETDSDLVAVLSPFVIFKVNSNTPRLITHRETKKLLLGWITMRGFGGGIESVGLIRREVLASTLRFDESLSTSSGLDFTLKLCQLGQIAFDKKIGLLYQISEGQWHSNSDELKRNMEIIRQKYSNFSGYDLNEWHLAYIYWSEIKTGGWVGLIYGLVESALHRKRYWRIAMIWSLALRNVSAKLMGFAHRGEIKNLLRR